MNIMISLLASPDLQERKKPYVDVTREMVFEHERQIACNGDLAVVVAPCTVESFAMQTWRVIVGIVWDRDILNIWDSAVDLFEPSFGSRKPGEA